MERARAQVLTQVNQALVLTYWQIGKTIKEKVVTEQRADYGDATMQKLADRLVMDYGTGFSRRNLFRMVKLYQQFGERQIVTTLSAQFSWSHFVEIVRIDDDLKRAFYTDMCAQSRWSVRTLRERMDGMLFERSAIAKQPEIYVDARWNWDSRRDTLMRVTIVAATYAPAHPYWRRLLDASLMRYLLGAERMRRTGAS